MAKSFEHVAESLALTLIEAYVRTAADRYHPIAVKVFVPLQQWLVAGLADCRDVFVLTDHGRIRIQPFGGTELTSRPSIDERQMALCSPIIDDGDDQ